MYKNTNTMIKLPKFCLIYPVEVHACDIPRSRDYPKKLNAETYHTKWPLLSTISSIYNINQPNVTSSKIQYFESYLKYNNQTVLLTWIPGHVEFSSDGRAYEYTNKTISSPDATLVQICSFKTIQKIIWKRTLNQWSHLWTVQHTKLKK